jgi:glyoxylase-like metal-dependent hydrolase (beta-lactamase superfamily II)
MVRVQEFFDRDTFTLSYVIFDESTRDAIILDPVLDYEPGASKLSTHSVEQLVAFVKDKNLQVRMLLETHAHADHVSGAQALKRSYPGAPLGIGSRITEVQALFKKIYNLPLHFPTNGQQFDLLFKDGQKVDMEPLSFQVLYTPGHTPACVSYLFEDKVFTGDALFMPDYGTGRCDFPGGNAADLYQSISNRLYTLPNETKVFTGHDYQPGGRPLKFQSTIGEEKATNIQLNAKTSLEDFVAFRQQRDAGLAAPRLLHPSVQLNIDAGRIPEPEANGTPYLKIPLYRT